MDKCFLVTLFFRQLCVMPFSKYALKTSKPFKNILIRWQLYSPVQSDPKTFFCLRQRKCCYLPLVQLNGCLKAENLMFICPVCIINTILNNQTLFLIIKDASGNCLSLPHGRAGSGPLAHRMVGFPLLRRELWTWELLRTGQHMN